MRCAIIPCDEFSCPQKFTNRDTINWTFHGKNRTIGLQHKEAHYGRINLYESRRLFPFIQRIKKHIYPLPAFAFFTVPIGEEEPIF